MSVAKSCPPNMPKSMVRKAKSTTPKIGGRARPQPALPREPQSGGALRVKLLFTESSELRKYTLPATLAPHKNVSSPLLRGEVLPFEFPLRPGQSCDNSAISINTHPNVIRFHHLMAQIA